MSALTLHSVSDTNGLKEH